MQWVYVICLALVVPVMYLLYINGFLVVQSKRAVLFYGRMYGRNDCSVTFSSCTGSVRRVLKCREEGRYSFHFDTTLSQGATCAQLLNREKLPLLTLDGDTKSGTLTLEPKQRYYIVLNFTSASGDCKLRWDKV